MGWGGACVKWVWVGWGGAGGLPHQRGIVWPVLACTGVLPNPNPTPNQESFFVSKGPRPVATASKFDPFAKKASSSNTAKGGKRPAAAGGGSKAKKKK